MDFFEFSPQFILNSKCLERFQFTQIALVSHNFDAITNIIGLIVIAPKS